MIAIRLLDPARKTLEFFGSYSCRRRSGKPLRNTFLRYVTWASGRRKHPKNGGFVRSGPLIEDHPTHVKAALLRVLVACPST